MVKSELKTVLKAEGRLMLRDFPLEKMRNIGIIAHIDAGKTTTTEGILYYTGRIYRIGEVDEGTATMDWMPQEKERGITIVAAATACYWQGYRLNLIDTPGHVDFTAEVERSLRVLDGGVVIFDSVAGVEAQSETVWRQADKYNVARICFINKMDRIGADFYRTVSMIEKQLQAKALPIQLPLGSENLFRGIIDLVENKAIIFADEPGIAPVEEPIPEDERVTATKYHQMLIEKLAEEDDQIMALYLEGQDISVPQLKLAIRRATISSRLVPILCGSALRNKGIQPLIDAIVDYLPSPIDMPPTPATALGRDEQILCYPKDEEPFAALAFKVVSDPFMGRLTYLRVYSGKVKTGAQVLNCNRNKKERIGKLYLMHANRREQREEADSGSIIAALGLKNTSTGDTLCDPARPLHFEAIRFPEPVLSMAITAKSKADKDRLDDVLAKFTIEDSTFNVRHDQETGQIIISGMGELQLEVLLDRMCREFGVKASVGKPEVAYKETIAGIIESEGRFVRQTGGRGQYGHVWLKLEPGERGGGFCFCNQIRGGAIPEEFIPPVEGGVKEALESGVLAGYPVVDIKVTLYDGSFHEVDSSDLAFKMAGFIAVKNGLKRARLILLEPIMSMEIITPTRFLGDITGELNSRRSHIGNIEVREEFDSIRCSIPLAETFGFASTLRSLSQGRATYSMQFHRYEELPRGLAERLVAGMRTR